LVNEIIIFLLDVLIWMWYVPRDAHVCTCTNPITKFVTPKHPKFLSCSSSNKRRS